MSFPLSGLNAVYSLGGQNLLALLEMAKIGIAIDSVDAAGLANTDEYQIPVKRASTHDFTVYQLNASNVPDTNLDISVWNVAGTVYLGSVKSGAINGSIRTKDVEGIAAFDKVPAFRRRATEVTTDRMVFSTSLVGAMASGAASSLSVLVSITYGTQTFTQQMLMTAGTLTIQGEETTMENITFKAQQVASSPSDSSLLGVYFGSAQLALMLETAASGGEQFSTSGGVLGLITRLNVSFAAGAIVKAEGTLAIQGALTYSTT